MENITVNGKPVEEYLNKEKSDEIREFYLYELRSMRSIGRRHIISAKPQRNVSRPKYTESGRVELR